jgi:D-glycero-D-manno-heptose 1,7-bisphosphate phosphatase
MGRVVVLDRDGVINEGSENGIKSPEEWIPLPGSLEAITRLSQGGFRVVVVTNQSELGRERVDIETLNRIHALMLSRLAEIGGSIEAIFFCPHRPRDACECRKPEPGLLLQVAERLRIPIEQIPAVGDSRGDLLAAHRAGAIAHLVRTGEGRATEADVDLPPGTCVHDDLAAFADHLLAQVAQEPTAK